MITSTTWVPRGFAAHHPKRIELDEKEFERISELAKLQLEDARDEMLGGNGGAEGEGEDDAMEIEEDAVEKAKTAATAATKEKKGMQKEKERPEELDDDLKEYNLEDYDKPTEEERRGGTGGFPSVPCGIVLRVNG